LGKYNYHSYTTFKAFLSEQIQLIPINFI